MKKGAARMKREEKTGRCRKKVESVEFKKGQLELIEYISKQTRFQQSRNCYN